MARDPCDPISYGRFRSGWDWRSVREILGVEQDQAREKGLYMWVSRSTVLGRLKEYKEAEYENYLRELEEICRDPANVLYAGVEKTAADPF